MIDAAASLGIFAVFVQPGYYPWLLIVTVMLASIVMAAKS